MESRWSQRGSEAQLAGNAWQATVDLTRPDAGCHNVVCHDDAVTGRLLGVTLPGEPTLIDHHVRGDDLVARYRVETRRLDPEIYWCYRSCEVAGHTIEGCEIRVSLQTERLDGQPEFQVLTQLGDGQLCDPTRDDGVTGVGSEGDPIVQLWRDASRRHSLLQIADGQDVRDVEIEESSDDSGSASRMKLLGEHLEKGVIRRVRLAVWFVPREDDASIAQSLVDRFVAAPPPLTT